MMMAVSAVLLVLGLVLLVAAAVSVWLGRSTRGHERVRGSESLGARGILEERFAAGEISTEEYEHRLSVLEGDES